MIDRQLRTIQSRQPKWLNSLIKIHMGTLGEIRRHIPSFERRNFVLEQPGNNRLRTNERLDTIIRRPIEDDQTYVPVGVVSKDYVLVPHIEVLNVAIQALKSAQIDLEEVKATLKLTEYGERMKISLFLPEEYNFDPGDGNPMALSLECVNSVEGSTRFRALFGWFRFICSNGLIIGITRADVHCRHVAGLELYHVGEVLQAGMAESEQDKKCFVTWRNRAMSPKQLIPWIEQDLRKAWGFKAATRAYHIAICGHDVEILGPYKDHSPTTIAVMETQHVPGAPEQCSNLFHVSQILAWLAKDRRDLQEQLEWREQIPDLLQPFV